VHGLAGYVRPSFSSPAGATWEPEDDASVDRRPAVMVSRGAAAFALCLQSLKLPSFIGRWRPSRSTVPVRVIEIVEAGFDIGMADALQSVVKALVGATRLNMLADRIIMFAGGNA
jgi:hypothetical protein